MTKEKAEKVKLTLVLIACAIVIVAMTIWNWPKYMENICQPWIDSWDEQME